MDHQAADDPAAERAALPRGLLLPGGTLPRLRDVNLHSSQNATDDWLLRGIFQEYYRRKEAKMAEEELGIRSKREPPKLTTPYITKTDSYTPGFLYHSIYTVNS